MKSLKLITTTFGLTLLLSSCATILKGSDQLVTISSNVQGATVSVNGKEVGKTPFTGEIERGSETVVVLTAKNYQAKTITLDTAIEPIFWGNVILGGVLGSTTDYSTGSMYKYAPVNINVDLTPMKRKMGKKKKMKKN